MLGAWQAIRATRAEPVAIEQVERAILAEKRLRIERDRAIAAEAQAKFRGR